MVHFSLNWQLFTVDPIWRDRGRSFLKKLEYQDRNFERFIHASPVYPYVVEQLIDHDRTAYIRLYVERIDQSR